MDVKETRIRPSSVTDFYSNEGAFTGIKVMQFSKLGVRKEYYLSVEGIQKG